MDSDYGYEQFIRDAAALRFATKISQYDGLEDLTNGVGTPDYFRLCTVIDELAHKFLMVSAVIIKWRCIHPRSNHRCV